MAKAVSNLVVLTMLLVGLTIAGCCDCAKVETAPWNDDQVEQMRHDDVKSVPIVRLKF